MNPRKPISKEQLEQQILSHLPKDSSQKPLVEPIKWMEAAVGPAGRFFRLDNNTPIACLPAYKDAQIYGIDIASAATVAALDVEPHHNVRQTTCSVEWWSILTQNISRFWTCAQHRLVKPL